MPDNTDNTQPQQSAPTLRKVPTTNRKKSKKKSGKQSNEFMKQDVQLQKSPLFFPAGFEKLFIVIYFVTIPYLIGVIFTFVILANSDPDSFIAIVQQSPFMLTWAIGYEILAALLILFIIKSAINIATNKSSGPQASFKRPM